MTAAELEKWLKTAESRHVGQKSGNRESTEHASGRHIVSIVKATKSDLTDDDYAHMRTVVGCTKRHLGQRPDGDVGDTACRYSLINGLTSQPANESRPAASHRTFDMVPAV